MVMKAATLTFLLVSVSPGWAAAGPFMPTGPRTTQPIGHYEFCLKTPGECDVQTSVPRRTPAERFESITAVNRDVNASIKPLSDMLHHGVKEVWSYPDDGLGDCEDYALVKRRKLIDAGIPAGNLLMTVADKADGERHALLTVRLSDGDYVLDNLSDVVARWDTSPYAFIKRQTEYHPGRWTEVIDGTPSNDIASASLK